MSLKEGNVPLIAVTPDDNINDGDVDDDVEKFRDMVETHTDVEDLEEDFDDMRISKNRRKIPVKPPMKAPVGDVGALTDVEDVEASGEEDEETPLDLSSAQFVAALEGVLDIEGTYEELFKYDSVSNSGKTVASTGQPTFRGLDLPEDSKFSGVVTDVEDFSASDDETIIKEDIQEVDAEFLGEMMENLGTVDIADTVKKHNIPPSPIHTPLRGSSPLRGHLSSHRLSPIPPATLRRLSVATDTEMLESDSDEERTNLSKTRRHSAKERTSLRPPTGSKGCTTDVEDLDFSDEEKFNSQRINEPYELSSLIPAQTEPSKESVKITYKPRELNITSSDGKLLGLPNEREDMLTDVEDVEVSGTEDENIFEDINVEHSKEQLEEPIFSIVEMDSMYGSVMESETTIDISRGEAVSLENPMTDTEDLAISSPKRFSRKRNDDDHSSVSSECSTEEGSVQGSDTETRVCRRTWKTQRQLPLTEIQFIDRKDGRDPVPVVVSPNASKESKKLLPKSMKSSLLLPKPSDGGATDIEELISSDDSDEDERKVTQIEKMTKFKSRYNEDEGGLTDLEDFEADNLEDIDFSPKLPPLMNPEDIPGFPPPVRELTLVKQDNEGHPTVLVLPLDEVKARGLFKPDESGAAPTDVEDITDSEDEVEEPDLGLRVIDADGNTTVLVTPELPLMEGGIVESTESMKVEKKRLKLPSQAMADPITDTEEMFLDTSPVQRKRKVRPRPQNTSSRKFPLTTPSVIVAASTTDVEELEVSDLESVPPGMQISKGLQDESNEAESTPYTSDAKTDLEDMEASDIDENDEIPHDRASSITPDLMRGYGLETISEKQGDGPFTEDVRERVLVQHTKMRSYNHKGLSRKQGSLGNVPTIRMTSPSPDIPTTTDTEDIFASADEGRESPTPPPVEISLELEEHSSVVHVKHTRKIDVDAPEEAMHVKGHRALDVLTDVEDMGLSEEEGQHYAEGMNDENLGKNASKSISENVLARIKVYDGNNKVCVCLASPNQDSTTNPNKVCVCVGKPEGDISIASESSVNSETLTGSKSSAELQQQENSESVETAGPSEEWTERMQQKQMIGHETVAPEDAGSEFYQMQDPEATSEYVPGQTTTQSRVVTTRTHTRTIMGEDGRPVTVTTTETEVGDGSSADGILDSNQLRESMQQIIDQFASGEETKEGRGKKEEKPE